MRAGRALRRRRNHDQQAAGALLAQGAAGRQGAQHLGERRPPGPLQPRLHPDPHDDLQGAQRRPGQHDSEAGKAQDHWIGHVSLPSPAGESDCLVVKKSVKGDLIRAISPS
jgi:hypothetical protein